MNIQIEARNMKLAAPKLANTSIEQRNKALLMIADALENSKDKIFAANDENNASESDATNHNNRTSVRVYQVFTIFRVQ